MLRTLATILTLLTCLASSACSYEAIDENASAAILKGALESIHVQGIREALDARGFDAKTRQKLVLEYSGAALRYGHTTPDEMKFVPAGDHWDAMLDALETYALYDAPKTVYGRDVDLTKRATQIQANTLIFQLFLLDVAQSGLLPEDWAARAALADLAYQFGHVECVASLALQSPLTESDSTQCKAESIRGSTYAKWSLVLDLLSRITDIRAGQANECESLRAIHSRLLPYLPSASPAAQDAVQSLGDDLKVLCEDPSAMSRLSLMALLRHEEPPSWNLTDELRVLTDRTIERQFIALEKLPVHVGQLVDQLDPTADGVRLVIWGPNSPYPASSFYRTARSLQLHEKRSHSQHRAYLDAIKNHNRDLRPLLETIPKL